MFVFALRLRGCVWWTKFKCEPWEVTNQLLSWPFVIVCNSPSNTETSRDNSFAFQDLKTNRCGFYFVHFDLKEQGWMQEIFIRCSRNVNADKYKYPANCSSWCHIAIWSNLSLSRQLNTQSAVACTIASLFIMGGQEIRVLLTSQCSYISAFIWYCCCVHDVEECACMCKQPYFYLNVTNPFVIFVRLFF